MFIRLNIIFVIVIIIPYLFIYLFLNFSIIKVQFFKNLTSKFNFQSQKFYYSRSFLGILFLLLLSLFHLFIYLFPLIIILFNY